MTLSEFWSDNWSIEPTFNPANQKQLEAYLFALTFWGDSIDQKGQFTNYGPSPYDTIGSEIQWRLGLDDETATLITDMAYQDVVDLRQDTVSFN